MNRRIAVYSGPGIEQDATSKVWQSGSMIALLPSKHEILSSTIECIFSIAIFSKTILIDCLFYFLIIVPLLIQFLG
jgi:hypothetical protein